MVPLSERSVLPCSFGKKGKAQEFNQSIEAGKRVMHMAGSSPLTAAIASQVISLWLILQGRRKESGKYKLGLWPRTDSISSTSLWDRSMPGSPWGKEPNKDPPGLSTGAADKGQLALVSGHTQPACRGSCPHTSDRVEPEQAKAQAPHVQPQGNRGSNSNILNSLKNIREVWSEKLEKNRIKILTFHTENNGHEVTNNSLGYEGKLICRVRKSCFSESRHTSPLFNGKHYLLWQKYLFPPYKLELST